ncbi:MAG: lipase family protein [Cyanobacteria bacterium P01_F01_bin.150]
MVDFQEILDYGMRSQLAYLVLQPGWYLTEKVGWRSPNIPRLFIEDVPSAEVNVIVETAESDRRQWIAVRGSSNLQNWILNVQYAQHNVPEDGTILQFHDGFYKAAQDVYAAICPHLRQDYSLRITGHSLGGAIAAILMVILGHDGYQIEKCITFGQPRVTNKEGAEKLTSAPLLRVRNQEDVVPLVPPSTVFTMLQGGYEHFGPEVHVYPGRYTYADSHATLESHGDTFWKSLGRAVAEKDISHSTDNIEEHFMRHYLLNIMSNMDSPDPTLEKLLS